MKTYVVLLRGVMPSGKNRVPMAQLRQVLSEAGFGEVRTYIQSGNVVLRTSMAPEELERQVHELIKQHIGADLVVVARTSEQLQAVLDANPFAELDRSRIFYTLFAQAPDPVKIQEFLSRDYSPDQVVITPLAAYMYVPGNAARSVLSNNLLEKKLGVSATTRNENTMKKMVEWGR